MKFPEICRCRNEEKNTYKQHTTESKLYLKDLPLWNFFKRKTNERRNFEKITKNQVICSFSLFGSVHSLSGVLSSISVLNFSSDRDFTLRCIFDGSIYSKRSLLEGFMRYKYPRGWSTATVSMRLKKWCNFFPPPSMMSGWQKAIKEKRRKKFWQRTENMKWFYDEKTWYTGS